MPKWKAITILGIIILSLFPVYLLYTRLQRAMKPRESLRHFLFWMLAVLVLIFLYTFLLVLLIKLLFPGA